ncbi:unnamed protein product [Adineta steineri]|uniref:Carrier domain-containing protein n=1 Tax=Adineta steineri TaxID=433720 RepID=A0A815M9E8_9BILA|nr:unnamed protein product [Adineta steineri]
MTTSYYVIRSLFDIARLYPQKVAIVLDNQVWTYSELIMQVERVVYQLHHLGVVQGQIIYQFVERSFEMICGFLAILYIGGVYCPLNPILPPGRLNIILEQMQGRYVLIHEKALKQFPIATVQHVIILDNILSPSLDIEVMSDLSISREYGAAFIIFTSGTTGPPKAVVHTHRSFSASIAALIGWDVGMYTVRDQVLQIAASSWITHIWEILLTLVVGGTLVLLRQGGLFDVAYFSRTLMHQQITTLLIGPAIIRALTNYIENSQQTKIFDTVRQLCVGGEGLKPQQWTQFANLLSSYNVQICVLYGTSESGVVLGCQLLNIKDTDIPIGYPLPTIQCLLIDDNGKIINTTDNSHEIGQIHIGGPTLFNCFLNNPELSGSRFTVINNQVFIKTGDLARYNEQGKLFYVERVDFQIKIRGQRVETTEIENTITNSYPGKISDCVVTKLARNDDLLVAYVVSKESDLDTEQIQNYCNKHLQQYMVPSIFVFLKQLPLNANGKVDRQRLPVPDISVLSTNAIDRQYLEPKNEMETFVHSVWCKILGCNRISTRTNFFSIGGHSLLFIQIYQYYQTLFNLDDEAINIRSFFEHNTIAEHAQLLENIKMNNIQTKKWQTLHINQCIASYAQQRIYLDEKMRFSGKVAIYNELTALQITKGSISMTRLLQALRCVLSIHKILRTSLVFNDDDNTLKQSITDKHLTFALAADQTFKSETELHNIISQINTNPNLFDLSSGRVFYCQILRQQMILDENHDKETLTSSDILVIGFHHAAIDQSSASIFLNDLCHSYNNNMMWLDDEESLQYIDYSVHERLIDMTLSREFWRSQLNGYDQECRLSLPVDRHCLYSDQRSGHASIAHISFDKEISTSFLDYASSHQVTPFQLGLAIFYAFLFKLTYRQNDLCISCLNANRYRTELQNMIGMFVSTLPYRIRIDSDWSFDELVEHVREKCLSILEHSHYPLQYVLTDSQFKQSNVPFLETLFNFTTVSENSQWSIDTATLQQLPMQQSYGAAKFDFDLTCLYNPASDGSKLSFCLTCSRDLFDETTAIIIVQRLKHLVDQLFSSKSISDEINPNFVSISKLSLILPTEAKEIEDTVFCRQQNIVNEAPASYAQARILSDERVRFDPDNPQLPIYNMPFLYHLNKGHTLSIQQLRQALQLIVKKHQSFRTLLNFDTEKNLFMQRIVDIYEDNNRLYAFTENTYETQEQLNHILHEERYNPELLDISQGLVFRCHLAYYKQISSNHLLSDRDVVIFNFHHVLFDSPSMNIFLHDLNQAYSTSQLLYDDITTLRYLDYAVIEQQMSMSGASMFWLDALHDCKLDQPLSLPFDRYRLSNEHRTCHTTSISFDFGQDLSHHFITHTSLNNISLEHLTFAIYFIFLFQLTNGQTDLCLAININNNRYTDELKSIIGLFENVIPLRCQLDPHWSFHQVLEHVQEITTNSMKYSYFPLQRILDQHSHVSKHAFLDTSLEFISFINNNDNNATMIGDSQLVPASFSFSINEDEILSISDFSLSIHQDLSVNQLSCTINASLDLFNRETVEKILQRFHFILHQLSASMIDNQMNKSIYEISLTLPNERLLIQSMNNTQVPVCPDTCIHHEFVYQVMKYSQKLAVELDEQSLTYAEVLHYVQILSLHLINKHVVVPGEVICQCAERSLSMVIGIMAIEMSGGVYCPLSSRDPQHRLHALIQQTQSRLVLVHSLTKSKFNSKIVSIDIHSTWTNNDLISDVNVDRLSTITVTSSNIAYIIFTSGSTGIPKAIKVRHINFAGCINSLVGSNTLNKHDTVVQMARCSFDLQLQEILGEPFSVKLRTLIANIGIPDCIVWNLYGSTEITLVSTYHLVDIQSNGASISVGTSLPNYQSLLLNKFLQSTSISQKGELFTGGVGVFAGYLGRDDLTAKALIEVDGELYYRVGDLLHMDENGLLHYQGRKDHQIKLHGQRIEVGEIERCLLNIISISACVVMKWNDDYLVAYVQSSDITEQELREHCQSHLPPHMIPSIFMILDKLPLNPNGKIDRKQLPSPEFALLPFSSSDKSDTPLNQFEERIHTIWSQVLHCNENYISRTTSFFSIGGHSLLLIQLYHHYQSVFTFDAHTLSIALFLQQPTIFQHSQLLQTVIMNNIKIAQWHTLHINEGIASFAQERIFLDEQVRFSSDIAIYNELITLQVVQGSLSLNRLLQAFRFVLNTHKILRTSLMFNNDDGILKQCITNLHKTFTITMNQTFQNENELRDIIYKTTTNPHLFDLSIGRVFHAEILRYQVLLNENDNNEFITDSDVLLIAFHHAAFDRASSSIFFNDLCLAYNTNAISEGGEDDDESLQYIDYSIHERLIDMTTSGEFWYLQLEEYNFDSPLLLPVDRHRLSNDHRSNSAFTTQISFDNEISQSFLDYASTHHVTPFQLGLSILYAFLFKITHGEYNLCISCLNTNRYRTELQNLIGMFVSTLPYCIQLDPHLSFDDLVKYVREKCLSILEHSHYPLQHILANLHINQSNISFLETMYDFINISSHSDELSLDGASFRHVLFEQSFEAAKFDFMLTFVYNPMLENSSLSFRLTCSRDLFDEITVTNIGRRLEYYFQQLFSSNETINRTDTCFTSVSKINLILPEETQELDDIIFCRQSHIINEAPASFAQARIWLDEKIRFDPDKPQVAIYNMPFVHRLRSGHTLSVKQLHQALQLTIGKHLSLHTSLIFDTGINQLMQRVITRKDKYTDMFSMVETIYEMDEQLNEILHDEKRNPHLFDLAQGLVFRCHLVYYKQISLDHLLSHRDLLIFNFHHALFDFPSMEVFHHDLNQAYTTGQLSYDDNTTLRYLDYAVIEQQMSMTGASMFWLDILHGCKLEQPLSLPFDRHRLSNEHRTGRGTSISFDFGQDLSHHFLTYASSNNISLEQLALATYYVFLFKLTNGERDLCIGINTHGRYRDELGSIIGMFVNAIPLRCQLDPYLSFDKLTKHVQDNMINCMKYSYFPLQRILNQHPNISNPVFLNTSFEFIPSMTRDEENEIMIGDSRFSLIPYSIKISEDEIMSKFDFILSFQHDLNLNEFSCTINASLDLFNVETVCTIGQRLQTMLHQQLTSFNCTTNKPIYELSSVLSNEQYLIQSLNNTQISFPSPLTCIHHEFVYQVMKHPQKLAVELDEQSLTYCELLHYVQVLSLHLINKYHVVPGEIICQCVERSLSMVIGIMGIEMAGGVYCPLSPRDPQHRLYALTQQTQSRLVFVHYLTKTKFDDDIVSLDINSILNMNDMDGNMNYNCLSSVGVNYNGIAYIIFTSGSTGTPKAVQVRQKNFIDCMQSLAYINAFNKDDIVVQMTRCSFDIHVQEILGTLLVGGTLSEPFSIPLIDLIAKIRITNCIVWNLYGPAEATIGSTIHYVDVKNDTQNIPIGRPFYNYRCMIMNQYLQSSVAGQEGELLVGGAGVFAGYLERDDLTAKTLVEINGELFYRTGDLVTMDNNGLLYYQGRKDHQIKLHGQRIELGEIERCLLNITSISACVVMKWNDNQLVAYVQSFSHINEEELRQHCQSHLPPHMIPSFFIILDKLPLNPNGKIDRKQLPSPDVSLSTLSLSDKSDTPLNQFEERIHTIWCQVLHSNENHISSTTSFFSVGGHSLLFIELYHHYQSVFNFDAHTLSIAPFLQQPTIFQHSQLLQTVIINNVKATQWYTLHINEGIASFAQERIFLDEQVRFSSDTAIYNELFTLQIAQGSLSLNRLLQALRYVLNKHKILRTSLKFNNDDGILKQCITNLHKTFTITMNQTFKNENELQDIIYKTTTNPHLFDLSTGRVFHAEILRHQISPNENENNSNEFITDSNVLLTGFHHAAFDRSSRSVFFNDLCLAYNNNAIPIEDDDESLQYIDYSVHERLIDMSTSREFWYLQLEEYNLDSPLSLPADRHRLSNDHRSNSACVTQISFDNEISQSFVDYASVHHVTPFQLGLTILYAFLFKLTHGENDLCISCLNANRYRNELQNLIGMFVSTLPYRVQLDSHWSFDDLVKYVHEKCLSILAHSHYPLQHILASLHINQSNISFLETMYDFITISSHSGELSLDGASLKQVSFEQSFEVAKFDFMLIFVYNPMLENNRLSFLLTCSHDLFDEITVTNMSRRLEYCFQQLFSSDETINQIGTCLTSISKFNLILPEETQEMENVIFCRQSHIIKEASTSFAQIRLWHNQSILFTPHISQVPIYNMPFVYHLHSHHTLSVPHLRQALQLIVTKHQSLRTSLIFYAENNRHLQRIIDMNDNNGQLFTFIESPYETQEQLNDIIHKEKCIPQFFDAAQGLVFRCHLVYYKQISSDHLLSHKDILIFNFHHSVFDYPSMNIFLHDLNQAYTTGQLLYDDSTTIRYLDYTVIEQQMSMTGASMFWLDALHNCKLEQSLSLSFDRYRLANEHRTCHTTSISFDFGQDLSHDFVTHASSNNISLEHLTFAIYFIFLFKLTNGQTDLCIAMNINNNRYRDELKSIIGLFENIIPIRCQLDPHCFFHQLLGHVQEITTNSMKYSYFPLQYILDQHPHISKHAFLDTSLEFLSHKSSNTIMVGNSQLVPGSFSFNINEDEILSAFDFSLSIYHDMNMNQLTCTINASIDLFNRETVEKISQRFHSILEQLSASMIDTEINKPIHELSSVLSNEQYLMQSLNNTQISFSSPLTCIHREFVYQVMKHPQKLAVELDEQSLTYCELLYYVQVLSLTLLNEYHVFPGEIVCQCVERSLSMVIGIMGIEMAGGVYCPLSPRDPQHRLHALTQQTQSGLVLVHYLTTTKFDDDIISCDIDSVLTSYVIESVIDVTRLSKVATVSHDVAYIIFTSGSTGKPKAVQVRHENFTHYIYSFVSVTTLKKEDTAVQMARSTFDVHLRQIVGVLLVGATLIMLRARGMADFDYLANLLYNKQITYLNTAPVLFQSFFSYLSLYKKTYAVTYLRSLCSGGEAFASKLIDLVQETNIPNYTIWNLYGPAETTITSTFHLVDIRASTKFIPIGRPLSNYRCIIMNENSQQSTPNQEGELCIGGVGVFAGYLGRDDLTSKALVEIDGERFYRTGDLVTMDNNGLLHYQGRKDHQIKLHGQRIELGEIERCLLNTTSSISACLVMKWKDDYLVAYVQSSDVNEEQLRQHCQSHLPPHMIPSIFIILDKLPLNQNGKVDRKLLPPPSFSSSTDNIDGNVPHTTLEQQLQDIFCQAFHIESPHVDVPFGQLGGTSLGAILALTLIRQQVCKKVDIGLLFTNPSVRQLAQAIEPLLVFEESQETTCTVNEIHETHDRLTPSFVIESLGIVLLVCQWLLPIMIIHQWCPLLFPILPICHLLSYVICSRLLSPRNIKGGNIFSWSYYRWWFLDRLWDNNTFWLQHMLGTPLYNYYLRLCGARVSHNAHIYTLTTDAPWLLDIGDKTWIADKTTLNCLYYNDNNTFTLHSIKTGCYCSISARSILFGGVEMLNNIIVQPMSSVSGFIASRTIIDGDKHKSVSSDISITHSNRSFSIWHKIYQVVTVISLICIHCTLLAIVYKVYSVKQIPLPISIAFCWTLWSILACFITLLLLKFVVGSCAAGEIYPIASWSYLHKVWLRQLIVSSFHHAWLLPTGYDYLYPFILRWLGAQVEDDVKLANIDIFLSYPTNLLKLETGVTAFGYVLIVPTEITLSGDHRVDWITLRSHTNLANGCSILPGSHLTSHTMVGNLTRINRETNSNYGDVFIGVPARAMPFQMPIREAMEDQIETISFCKTCISYYISKCLFIGIYLSCGLVGGPIIHTIIVCSLYRWYSYTDSEIIKQIVQKLQVDHRIFICSFLGNTQWLIRFFRAYGANIGNNVIIPEVSSLFDYNLLTIGDHVRLNINAHIVCHTFEQRILKRVPVTVGKSCILMSGSVVMSGCKLMGNNRLYPFTLIMKNDLLQPNTQWKGLPAQSYVAKPVLSRSALICDDVVKCKQKSKNFDRLFLWNEQISNVYTNVNELQFMNWGYADLDEHINDNTGYYSEKLYQQILANITLTDQNILEVGCGRGAGAAWCVRKYAPRSYVGMDPSRNVINLCQQTYSTTPRLSFMVAGLKTYLSFQNESMDVVLSIETTNIFDETQAVKEFVDEITRVLTPNGYFLWCGLCNVDGSSLLIDYLTANNGFIIKEKANITRNVLHALDMQSNSRADFIDRYIQSADQEYCRLLAGLPGTELYDNMQQGRTEYWRVVFRKKITTDTPLI